MLVLISKDVIGSSVAHGDIGVGSGEKRVVGFCLTEKLVLSRKKSVGLSSLRFSVLDSNTF